MSISELQIDLINRITHITDEFKLKEILDLLKFQSDDTVFEVPEEDKIAIKDGRKQIKNGQTLTCPFTVADVPKSPAVPH